MQRHHRILLVCILVVASLLRLVVVMAHVGTPLYGDEPSYDSIAWNMVIGHGFCRVDSHGTEIRTAMRGPSYIFFLMFLYMIAGHNVLVPMVAQVLLDTASCLLIFYICRYLFKRPDIALLAAFLYAVCPQIIMCTRLLITETFVIFFLLLSILGYLKYSLVGSRSGLVMSAIAVGIVGLSKPILYLVPILLFIASAGDRPFWERAKVLAIQLSIVFMLMTPWIIRNALAFHAFIPGVTNGGITFWGGIGPAAGRVLGGLGDPGAPEYAKRAVAGMTEKESEKWFYHDGIRIIKENPGRYAKVVLSKLPRLWFNIPYYEAPTPRNWFFVFYHVMLWITAVIGIKALKPPRVTSRFLWIFVLYFTGVHLLYFSTYRYSLPVYAFMFCFSAGGIVVIMERLGLHRVFRKKPIPC